MNLVADFRSCAVHPCWSHPVRAKAWTASVAATPPSQHVSAAPSPQDSLDFPSGFILCECRDEASRRHVATGASQPRMRCSPSPVSLVPAVTAASHHSPK